MNRITESLKYFTVIFQMKTNFLSYFKSIYNYKIKKKVTFPSACVNLRGIKFLTRKNTLDIVHVSNFYEKETTKFFLKYKSGVFVDIGAHIGRFSALMAAGGSKVISLEASKYNFDQLERNIKFNQFQEKITAINIGCSDKNGEHIFYFGGLNEGANSLDKIEGAKSEKIKVRKLDKIINDLCVKPENISLIKIDVEGAEMRVLKGAENILKGGSPTLLIEILDFEGEKKIGTFLKKFGYINTKTLDQRNFIFEKRK